MTNVQIYYIYKCRYLISSILFPPADYPRERNPRMIPVLFAKAQPNIGLQFEKRKSVIKQE